MGFAPKLRSPDILERIGAIDNPSKITAGTEFGGARRLRANLLALPREVSVNERRVN
jgi:hypothetical protein